MANPWAWLDDDGVEPSAWLSGDAALRELRTDEIFAGGASPPHASSLFDEEKQPAGLAKDFSPGRYFSRRSAQSTSELFPDGNGDDDHSAPPHSPASKLPPPAPDECKPLCLRSHPGHKATKDVALTNSRSYSSNLSLSWSPRIDGFSASLTSTKVRANGTTVLRLSFCPARSVDAQCHLVLTADSRDEIRVPVRLRTTTPEEPCIEASERVLDFGRVSLLRGGSASVHLRNASALHTARLELRVLREQPVVSCFSISSPASLVLRPGESAPVLVDLVPDTALPAGSMYSCAVGITAHFSSAKPVKWALPCRGIC